jgi:tRNA G37 N-methylase Trm5
MSDNPLEPGPQDYDRINANVESEIAYWSKELGVSRERLARAIEEVGEKVVDVRRQLGLMG